MLVAAPGVEPGSLAYETSVLASGPSRIVVVPIGMAAPVGFEPTPLRLTGARSAVELQRSMAPFGCPLWGGTRGTRTLSLLRAKQMLFLLELSSPVVVKNMGDRWDLNPHRTWVTARRSAG